VIVAADELRSFPVSFPELLTLTAPLLLDHETLPVISPADDESVLVPVAWSCVVPPSGTFGLLGVTVIEESCSFGKKPVQLMARANIASAAGAPTRRRFCW
jgi:hypothetical protein